MAVSKKNKRGKRRKISRKSARRRSAMKYRKIECQLGRAALMYSKAKGYLSGLEKYMAEKRRKAENPDYSDPHQAQIYAKRIADVIRAAAKEVISGKKVSKEELDRRIERVAPGSLKKRNPRRRRK